MNNGQRLLVVFVLGLGVLAQGAARAATRWLPSGEEVRRNRFSNITRLELEDDHGQPAGKLKDFIISSPSGIVRYGVVGGGGTLGLNRVYKVVPARILSLNTAKRSVIGLSVSRFKLSEAFDFNRRELSALQQPARGRELDVIFGLARQNSSSTAAATSSGETSLNAVGSRSEHKRAEISRDPLVLASDLIGNIIVNSKHQKIAKLSDLLIDPSGNRPAIALFSSGHLLKRGVTYAVPLRRLVFLGHNRMSIDAEAVAFASAPMFDLGAWEKGIVSDTVSRYDDTDQANRGRIIRDGGGEQPGLAQRPDSVSDNRLTQRIRDEISGAPGLSLTARDIKITTLSGKVMLAGVVLTADEKARILEIARQVAGPDAVTDKLDVRHQ